MRACRLGKLPSLSSFLRAPPYCFQHALPQQLLPQRADDVLLILRFTSARPASPMLDLFDRLTVFYVALHIPTCVPILLGAALCARLATASATSSSGACAVDPPRALLWPRALLEGMGVSWMPPRAHRALLPHCLPSLVGGCS